MLPSTAQQKKDTIVACITYEFIHVDDTNNVDHPYTEDLIVELSEDASHQKSLTMDQVINGATSQIDAQNESKGVAKGLSYNLSHLKDASSEEIYIFPANREIFVSNVIVNTYYNLIDEYPDVKWSLSEDTATISGYHCQKATTSFMGRNYQAWFTSDIPLPYGPWKLHGLPGLILTVSDLEEQIQFKFKGIEFPDREVKTFSLPKNHVKISKKEYARLFDEFKKNPDMVIKTSIQHSGNTINVVGLNKTLISSGRFKIKEGNGNLQKIINNPIER